MKLFKNFGLGLETFFEAWSFLFRNNLWFYIIVPGIIAIFFFVAIFIWGWALGKDISDAFINWIGLNSYDSGWLKVVSFLLGGLLTLLLRFAFILLYVAIYKTLVLIVLSPFLALLSEKVDRILNNREFPFSFSQLLKDAGRGIAISLRNFFLEILFIVLFFILSFIPIIGFLSPFALFIISSYYMGFSMLDYSCERHRMDISSSIRFINNNKGIAISNGMFFNLLMLVPFVGLLFAPAVCVTGATLAFDRLRQQNSGQI